MCESLTEGRTKPVKCNNSELLFLT